MLYYQERTQDILQTLGSSDRGLNEAEVARRLKKYGPNTIRIKGEPWWLKLIEPFRNIFMLVLIVAAITSAATGEPLDALIIVLTLMVSAGIYYVQRFSTSRVLRALRRHHLQMVEVIRDSMAIDISSEDLVPGDILLIHEGDKLSADARLMHADNLRCDESMLTGESVAVSKQVHPLEGKKEVYEQTNMVYQGSFAVAGEATAVVVATGNNTEFGQLAKLMQDDQMDSPVQRKIDQLISRVIIGIVFITLAVFGLSLYRGMELTEALRFMLVMAVSAVPEGLPVAISVILVLGMHRMAKRKALVRTMRAIEDVGVLTTIATDKTGTLTKNQLTVQQTWQLSTRSDEAAVAQLTLLAVNLGAGKMHDPLDGAMHRFAVRSKAAAPRGYEVVGSIPFEHSFAMSGNVWRHGTSYELVLKGAPEHVLARCGLSKAETEEAHLSLHSLTGQGYRVIALAQTSLPRPITTFDELPKDKLEFAGFLAVADVLRPEARGAIASAHQAGVSVRMITGDHFETAFAIGKQLGMVEHRDQVFDSRQMAAMTDSQLAKVIETVKVFSRVVPEAKYRILSILKKHDITAMTGDGVNDVPALTNAHVGVAMGSGSQIAREAGDIVLLDNNFKSLIVAMREGRIIFSNIRRILFYLLATSSGEVLTMVGALIVGLPLPVVAVQVLWINLVTDTAMVIPLGLEPAEKNIMKTKPRRPETPILGKFMISRIVLVALTMAVLTLSTFAIFLQFATVDYARTIAFSVLVVAQWANALNARSELQSVFTRLGVMNIKFYLGLAIAMTLQALALFGPFGEALHVVPVQLSHLVITGIVAVAITIFVCEAHKLAGRRIGGDSN